MPAAGFVTLAAVVLAVLVIAVYLIAIALILHNVGTSLDEVIGVVAQIPARTEPIGPVLGQIAAELAGARAALEGAPVDLPAARLYRARSRA
jgi:hypothetical protein